MKEKNKNNLLTTLLGGSLIFSLAFVMASNVSGCPLHDNAQSDSYMVADGHKHMEDSQENTKEDKCNPDKGQNCTPPLEINDSQENTKEDKCNPDKGQNCTPPSW
ncbi:MAG: hypothetical protein CMF40_01730 [Legionellales bacterium]|nr:hypothetical protein [Legionellales bacterium]